MIGDQRVLVKPYKGVWRQVRVCHVPMYLEYGTAITTPTDRRLEESVRYSALVLQVELRNGGELTHSSARMLSGRGWGLLVEPAEQLAHVRAASEKDGEHAPLGRRKS